jgi:hypothetical protein
VGKNDLNLQQMKINENILKFRNVIIDEQKNIQNCPIEIINIRCTNAIKIFLFFQGMNTRLPSR